MKKSEKDLLDQYSEKYNFLDENFLDEIERVDIFCENCAVCSRNKECDNIGTFGFIGRMLMGLHQIFKEAGVDSHLHEFTSENNKDLEEVASQHDCVLLLKTLLHPGGVLSCPMHNFMQIVMKSGHKLLYDVDTMYEENELSRQDMMYV